MVFDVEQIFAGLLGSDLNGVILCIAHVVQRLFILTRSWVKVELFGVLGAHACHTLSLVERRSVLLVVARSRCHILHLLFPDLFPLGFRDSDSHASLLCLGLAHIILSWTRVIISLRLVLATHVDALGCFAKCVRLIHVVTGTWNRLFLFILP